MELLTNVLNSIKPILETLYYLASIGLFATVIIGLKQLQVVKKDMNTRNQRAAVEKSIEYLKWFSSDYLPKFSKMVSEFDDNDVEVKINPINPMFLPDESHKTKEVQAFIAKAHNNDAIDMLNSLEFFSAAVLNGLADEEIVYKPIVKPYCSVVCFLYPVICNYRVKENSTSGFSNIIELFEIWNSRHKKETMKFAKSHLEREISEIADINIKSIGL
ncbi:DUF4760 domain-containing protein [Bacillus cereus group sp. IBL03679]|uniref:DUF4760 domain-containing protein n=1 Tax=Bacillus cereus group sp. IBL03679 TaxID=3240095 RepID=UPI003D2F7A4C